MDHNYNDPRQGKPEKVCKVLGLKSARYKSCEKL